VFCVEVGQIATGVLPSEWLLSRAVVFGLVTANAALGRHGPIPGKQMIRETMLHEPAHLLPALGKSSRKANDRRNLVIFRLFYPLSLRKNLNFRCRLGGVWSYA
jgi:hypothetical protein